jgi:hypothetical protein
MFRVFTRSFTRNPWQNSLPSQQFHSYFRGTAEGFYALN